MTTGENPLDQKIKTLRSRYDSLRDDLQMADVTRTLGDVATSITGLGEKIAAVRGRGYAFAGYLERKAEVLKEQWEDIRRQVQDTVRREIERIQSEAGALADLWTRLDARSSEGSRERLAEQIEHALGGLETALKGAKDRIQGLYGTVPATVSQTQTQLSQIERYLAHADQATFPWKPTEAVYQVVEAEWVQSGKGKEDPDGLLYLSDQRILFEQNEKVGGRLGFGGQQVRQLVFEMPIGAIDEVKPEDKGLFGGKDLVHVKFKSGEYGEATFEVKGGSDSKAFAAQINRVVSGEIEKERAIPVDAAAAQAVQNAPTACSTCGAVLPPIVRGMTEITCQYCGTVTRL